MQESSGDCVMGPSHAKSATFPYEKHFDTRINVTFFSSSFIV